MQVGFIIFQLHSYARFIVAIMFWHQTRAQAGIMSVLKPAQRVLMLALPLNIVKYALQVVRLVEMRRIALYASVATLTISIFAIHPALHSPHTPSILTASCAI